MELVIVPDSKTPCALPFYLSLEEWLARKYPGRDFFFMWQVEPTVIVGRHQLIEREVDTQFCHSRGI
ncbi:MAG: lipoyl synthase, partial [Duncaniella sp.]|nr:lipoyl synthase [Duncaniella sp.]